MVENYVISRHNHSARGDYNYTETLIFKMAVARFLDVFKEEKSKMKENAVALTDNHLSNYTKTIILLRLSEYCRIIYPLDFVSGDYSTIRSFRLDYEYEFGISNQ